MSLENTIERLQKQVTELQTFNTNYVISNRALDKQNIELNNRVLQQSKIIEFQANLIAEKEEFINSNRREFKYRVVEKDSLTKIQEEHKEWYNKQPWASNTEKQLGANVHFEGLLGVIEEVGELAHAFLKQFQGIRGTYQEHEEAGKDAVGDIIIYLMSLCNKKGWNLNQIVSDTWNKVVKKRDFNKNSLTGASDVVINKIHDKLGIENIEQAKNVAKEIASEGENLTWSYSLSYIEANGIDIRCKCGNRIIQNWSKVLDHISSIYALKKIATFICNNCDRKCIIEVDTTC